MLLRPHFLCFLSLATTFGLQSRDDGYNETLARQFASLASAAYCHNVSKIMDWTCGPCQDSNTSLVPGKIKVITAVSTQIIVGKIQEQDGCLISFRGSSNTRNWISNLHAGKTRPTRYSACKGCEVHKGWNHIWETAKDKVIKALWDVGCSRGNDKAVYVTGHSLGAAVSHLAMFTLAEQGWDIVKTYTFEAPRVGNKKFSEAFTKQFSRNFPVFRVTHHEDPVVHLPPEDFGYYHVETEVYYDANGTYRVCVGAENNTCADQFSNIRALMNHTGEHCASPLVPSGSICGPQNCD